MPVPRRAPHLMLRLGFDGRFVDPQTGTPVADPRDFVRQSVVVPVGTTDVFVWVHGWQHDTTSACDLAGRVFGGLTALRDAQPGHYAGLDPFRPFLVAVHWPSESSPTPWGYASIRDRAHAMTDGGHAEYAIAALLGYCTEAASEVRAAGIPGGAALHCVGHSFGGRFLGAAICEAANPALAATAAHPFTVDSLVVFQMAARPTVFADRFSRLLDPAPLRGPVVLTHSRRDIATRWWHRFTESGKPGIGAFGATAPVAALRAARLARPDKTYPDDLWSPGAIVNVDANAAYRTPWPPNGAHSDYARRPESFHLLLSVADAARRALG